MKNSFLRTGYKTGLLAVCILLSLVGRAQQGIIINLAPIDGIELTPDNVFNFQVQSTLPGITNVTVKGNIHYRNSTMQLNYTFTYALKQGMNILSADQVHPSWQFSSSALQELFMIYKKLPEGAYEYCVTMTPQLKSGENSGNSFDDCLYHRASDLFLINLIEPDNNAKIHEYNPLLTWVANYQFASELTYRIRVAAIMHGQNPQNAITRNNPVYDENNLMQNSIVYPVYAKPLQVGQPYAWTVDAYYKGILLGGAETWKFTIVEDTLYKGAPGNMSYIDITREKGATQFTAIGHLKLKYILQETRSDTLTLQLLNASQNEIKLKGNILAAKFGDNRYEINFKDSADLKDNNMYKLIISTKSGEKYILPFNYLNPDFIK